MPAAASQQLSGSGRWRQDDFRPDGRLVSERVSDLARFDRSVQGHLSIQKAMADFTWGPAA